MILQFVVFIVALFASKAVAADGIYEQLQNLHELLTKDFSVEKWGIESNREDQYRILRKANIDGKFKHIVGENPIFVYEGPTYMDSRVGNLLGDFFEVSN